MDKFIKKWWLCCIISAVLGIICTAIIIKSFDAVSGDIPGETRAEQNTEDIKDIILAKRGKTGTDGLCIVVKDENADILNHLYNNRYLLLENISGYWMVRRLPVIWDRISYVEAVYEKYDLDLYDIDTLQLANHIDGKKLMSDILDQNEMYSIASFLPGEDRTLQVSLTCLYGYKEGRRLVYDLLTGEPAEGMANTDGTDDGYQKKLSLLTVENIKEKAYEYSLPGFTADEREGRIPHRRLPARLHGP